MAKLPIYQQQTTQAGPRASGEQFGSMQASAISQAGNTLVEIGQKIQTRNETINRVRTMNQFEQQVMEDFTALRQSEDISNPETIEKFRNTIRERREAALNSFQGRPGVRSEFRSQLENMEGQYVKNAIASQIEAQHKLIAFETENIIKTTSDLVVDSPESFDEAVQRGVQRFDALASAMPQGSYDTSVYSLRQATASAAAQSLMQRGEIDALEQFINRPDVTEFLNTDAKLEARAEISKVRYEREQRRIATDNLIATVESVRGPVDESTRAILATMPDPSKMTSSQKLFLAESVMGPMSEAERKKFLGVYIADSQMNKANALNIIKQGWQKYAQGAMTPDEKVEYQMAWQSSGMLPGWRTNEITGRQEWVEPVLPPDLKAMRNRVMGLPGQTTTPSHNAPASFARDAAEVVSPGYSQSSADIGQMDDTAYQEMTDSLKNTILADGKGLYQMAENMAGPVPRFKEMVFNWPVIGDKLGIDPTMAEDRKFAEGATDQVIRAFALNPRYPVAEVERIINTYPVGPDTWSNPTAYRSYLRAIDRTAMMGIKTREAALAEGNLGPDTVREYNAQVSNLKSLRQIINIPEEEARQPMTLTGEQARELVRQGSLKPGDTFLDAQGNSYSVSQELYNQLYQGQ